MKCLYFVSCMELNGSTTQLFPNGEDSLWPDFGEEYVHSFWETLDEAIEQIKLYPKEIYNSKYEYVLIEKMEEKIHPICFKEDRYWFKYNKDLNLYEQTEEVENLQVCNWALG